MKTKIPYLLILFRFLLIPCFFALAFSGWAYAHIAIVVLMYLGLLSDILDGIVARQMQVSSTKLRRLDSQVDMLFWLSIGIVAWIMYKEVLAPYLFWIFLLLATELSAYLTSLLKFRKETCTHAYLSKFWGLTLLAAFTSIIGFGYAGFPFYLALIAGYVSHLDRILIYLFLPQWSHDIPSCYHAWQIRKGKSIKRFKLFNG